LSDLGVELLDLQFVSRLAIPTSARVADSDDLARVYRFDLAQDSEMISPTISI